MLPKSLPQIAVEEGGVELTDSVIYSRLAPLSPKKNEKIRAVFQSLAEMEQKHSEFWKKYIAGGELKVNRRRLYLTLLIWKLLGASFGIKYLERHEKDSIEKFERLKDSIPSDDKATFEVIVRDEGEHWKTFADQVQNSYVRYISFIILGLADSLVEISGIHAGSLGFYNLTLLSGLAGIVAGGSASIAMASAAFAQAKQGFEGSATLSAAYTGVSYFISAILLATPYFLTTSMVWAIGGSLFIGVCIITFTSYYNSVISSIGFTKEFATLAGVMFLATVALYIFGTVIATIFHVKPLIG